MKKILALAAVMAATAPHMGAGDLMSLKQPKPRLKEARGRGNQGDWAHSGRKLRTEPEHDEWNAKVRTKHHSTKSAKAQRKKTGKEKEAISRELLRTSNGRVESGAY